MGEGVILIELAGPPVGKGRPRFVRKTGRTYTPSRTRDYEDRLRLAAVLAMRGRKPLAGALELGMMAYLPIPQSWSRGQREAAARGTLLPTSKPDGDNILKLIDSLNGVVWADDAQVTDTVVRKRYATDPMLRIVVREMGIPPCRAKLERDSDY